MGLLNLISSDSHLVEYRGLWAERADKAFRDKAPRVVQDPEGKKGEYWVMDGLPPMSTVHGAFHGANQRPTELEQFDRIAKLEDILPGSYDPAARMKDMDLDGVQAEVIYPGNMCLVLYWLKDALLQRALFRAVNDWHAEFCSYNPKRLAGLGLISLLDVDEGIKEIKRCAKMGLKAGLIGNETGEDTGYQDRRFDPFWAACVDLNMIVAFHNFTGLWPPPKVIPRLRFTAGDYPAKRVLSEMIFSGVFDRFPQLRVVLAEFNVGWLPQFLWTCDDEHRGLHGKQDALSITWAATELKMMPSDYFRRNVWASFMDDPYGVQFAPLVGADRILWSSDYPHPECTWPNSRKYVDRNFQGVSNEIKQMITHDNGARLYGFPMRLEQQKGQE